jgi:hypothetical protein
MEWKDDQKEGQCDHNSDEDGSVRRTNENPGRPSQSLIAIMNQFKTEDFDTVFREFSKREPIYGFGDLQVKRLLDQILSNH